jgi:hypothetical protein
MIGIRFVRSRALLAAVPAAMIGFAVLTSSPASAYSTVHTAQCAKGPTGVWNVGFSINGYSCAIEFETAGTTGYLRVTGETGAYTWNKVGSATTATGKVIPISPNQRVLCGVTNKKPHLLTPGVLYNFQTVCAFKLIKTNLGLALKLITPSNWSAEYGLKPGAAPVASTAVPWA